MTTDTDALVATVREVLDDPGSVRRKVTQNEALAALDALAAELRTRELDAEKWRGAAERMETAYGESQAELERVKAERDGFERECEALENENARLLDRLDKALAALLRIKEEAAASWIADLAAETLAEIEGEALS